MRRHALTLIPAHDMPGYQKFTLEDVVYKDGDTKEDTKKDTTVGNDFAHE